MKQPNLERLHVRKWFVLREETHATESGRLADGPPVVKIVVAAAVQNPHAGTFGEDFTDVFAGSTELGKEFARRIVEATEGQELASYGKACLVGVQGEYEHGNAFLTTEFATPVREALGGAIAWMPSTGKRGGPGQSLDIPLAHKNALYVRSHYDTATVTFSDAPAPDEVVVAVAVATRGRLHARLGGPAADEVIGVDGLR
jgi:Amino acid synthesis